MAEEILDQQIRQSAIIYLSMREHSYKELVDKLRAKYADEAAIHNAILRLQELDFQCDERFAMAYARMKARQGKGPLYILMELGRKGVAKDLIRCAIYGQEIDWFEQAKDVRQRKFGELLPSSPKDKAKQLRFLASRGFPSSEALASFGDVGE